MFVSGLDEMNNIYQVAHDFKPNVLFRHTAGSVSAKDWAKTIARYNTQVAFPKDQDYLYYVKWSKSMDEFSSEIQAELKNLGSITQFINPEPYKWYTILMGISKED